MNRVLQATFGLALLSTAATSSALNGLMDTLNTCSTTNCQATPVNGVYFPGQPANFQVFAQSGSCLRLEVFFEVTDLEFVLVAPDGTVWRNDDGGGSCAVCPLIEVDPVPQTGWYTLQVSSWTGSGTAGGFRMLYGLYNSGNLNCSSPTMPEALALDQGFEREIKLQELNTQ